MPTPKHENGREEGSPSRKIWTLRITAIVVVLLTYTLSTRLVAIQVVNHDRYLTLRDGQSRVRIPIQPERGRLLDKKGKELSVSRSRVKSLF
ncbi:MAG: hypothetical protein ACYTHN_06710, partial [Planctomycetota bacterium]